MRGRRQAEEIEGGDGLVTSDVSALSQRNTRTKRRVWVLWSLVEVLRMPVTIGVNPEVTLASLG